MVGIGTLAANSCKQSFGAELHILCKPIFCNIGFRAVNSYILGFGFQSMKFHYHFYVNVIPLCVFRFVDYQFCNNYIMIITKLISQCRNLETSLLKVLYTFFAAVLLQRKHCHETDLLVRNSIKKGMLRKRKTKKSVR